LRGVSRPEKNSLVKIGEPLSHEEICLMLIHSRPRWLTLVYQALDGAG